MLLDSLKLYIRPEMFVEEKKLKDNKTKNNKQNEIVYKDKDINKIAEDSGIKNTEFVISNINENSVFDDEIPIIMEE